MAKPTLSTEEHCQKSESDSCGKNLLQENTNSITLTRKCMKGPGENEGGDRPKLSPWMKKTLDFGINS